MTGWLRSSFCADSTCVEVALVGGRVLLRDSARSHRDPLVFTLAEWRAFVAGVEVGDFDFETPARQDRNDAAAVGASAIARTGGPVKPPVPTGEEPTPGSADAPDQASRESTGLPRPDLAGAGFPHVPPGRGAGGPALTPGAGASFAGVTSASLRFAVGTAMYDRPRQVMPGTARLAAQITDGARAMRRSS